MEELTKQAFETIEMEAIESTDVIDATEVLDGVVNNESDNKAVINVIVGITVLAGIYGVKKFITWRKNRKYEKWMKQKVEEIDARRSEQCDVSNVNTEMESDEDLI